MAKNEVSSTGEGRHIELVYAGIDSGDMVLAGTDGLHGVAFIDTNDQGNTVIDIGGRWMLPVKSGATIEVWDAVYCNQTGGTLDNDPDHGIFFGYALSGCTNAQTGDRIDVLVVQGGPAPAGS